MRDVYILDKNLQSIGIIDGYKSLIWANRYGKLGDCELYVTVTAENLQLVTDGTYMIRPDDDMVCEIVKIEITTDAEEGNFLIVHGRDIKALLDQRIIWTTQTCNGRMETFVRDQVSAALIDPANTDRRVLKANGGALLALDADSGIPDIVSEQVSYKNLGEKVREYCETYQTGYRIRENAAGTMLLFGMYKGTDRSGTVVFSDKFENLASTKYAEDVSSLGNVALIGGQGEGSDRVMDVFGQASGTARHERFVDADDISTEITYAELKATYPLVADGGYGSIYTTGGKSYYRMSQLDVQVMSPQHLEELRTEYPGGTEITIDGQLYYRLTTIIIADLPNSSPADDATVTIRSIIYHVYLLNRGAENLAQYGKKITFDGSVVPDVTFKYKEDYFLGDIVTVENVYGISAKARITEVVEVLDDQGYSMEPTFEWLDVDTGEDTVQTILTAENRRLLTQGGQAILTESSASAEDGVKISELPEIADPAGYDIPAATSGSTGRIPYETLVEKIAEDVNAVQPYHVGDTFRTGEVVLVGRSYSNRTKMILVIPLPRPIGEDVSGIELSSGAKITIRQANGTAIVTTVDFSSNFTLVIMPGAGDTALSLSISRTSGTIGSTNGELLHAFFSPVADVTFTFT